MFNEKTVSESRRLAEVRDAAYEKLSARFANAMPAAARDPKTHSGLPLKTAYFPHDIAHLDFSRVGAPGSYPFTRGNLPAQYQLMNWANQPVIGYGLPEDTRARMDLLAEKGMIGYFGQRFYNLVYDNVSHEGLDPDHPAARGHIGKCGMAVYSTNDMDRLFEGMDLTKMNVIHIAFYEIIPTLAQYIALGRRRGLEANSLSGNSMNWYHQGAYTGMNSFNPDQGLKLAVELISYCNKHMPRWNTTNFFGYGIEEAGGNAVQEIGLMLAYAVELVEACQKVGIEPDQALPRFGFQIAQANDFFEEVCKIRALRRIWSETMHDRFGAKDPRSMHVRIHTHTSGVTLTAQQPMVNLIRTTLQAFGAALSGVQAMEVSGYDEAFAIPTEEAATLALRVQQVIQKETNVAAVSDPLAGSYYVEALTDQIAEAALELAAEVERQGGYVAAQESGWVRRIIDDSAERWRDAVDSGERQIVGLNCYQAEDAQPPEIFTVDPDIEPRAIARIKEHRANRDGDKFNRAMEKFRAATERFAKQRSDELGDDGLMVAAIEAAEADATTGEMMTVMKEYLGWSAARD